MVKLPISQTLEGMETIKKTHNEGIQAYIKSFYIGVACNRCNWVFNFCFYESFFEDIKYIFQKHYTKL